MRIAAVLGVLALGIGVAQADIPKGAPPVIIPPPPVPMPLPPKPAPPLPPTPKVRAKPVESPGSWINPDDYPPVALRFDMTGISAFRLFIDAEGKPSHCQITAGSGFQILDDAACERLMEHGKFSPAQDAKGRAVADVWNSRVVWRLPFADPQPLREGNGVATLMISKMGIVTHCAVKVDVPDHETSQNMCWDTDSIPRLAALEMRGYGEAPMTEVEMEWSSALSSAARDRFILDKPGYETRSLMVFRFEIDPAGKMTRCAMERQKGNEKLVTDVCYNATKQLYAPFKDATGAAVCPKPSPWCARPASACSACATSTCS
jgi:sulfur relay (sulfurtransferase) DsrC/TusE family protein